MITFKAGHVKGKNELYGILIIQVNWCFDQLAQIPLMLNLDCDVKQKNSTSTHLRDDGQQIYDNFP